MSGALRASGLSKTYGKVPVLNSLDFDVSAGSVFALIGPNGAGKTTTIKIMMNIQQPTSGAVEMFGVDSRRLGRMISRRSATSRKTRKCRDG